MILLLRGLVWIVLIVGVTTCTFTVKLGERTTAQHIRRIWATDETKDLVRGAEQKAGPVLDRVKQGVKAGVKGAADSDPAEEADREVDAAADAARRRATEAAEDHAREEARDKVRKRSRSRDRP